MHEWNRFSWSAWCLREFWILSVPVVVVDAFYVLCWILFSFFAQLFCRNFCHIFFLPSFSLYVAEACIRLGLFEPNESISNGRGNQRWPLMPNKIRILTDRATNPIIGQLSYEACLLKNVCARNFAYKALESGHWIHIYTENCMLSVVVFLFNSLSLCIVCRVCVCFYGKCCYCCRFSFCFWQSFANCNSQYTHAHIDIANILQTYLYHFNCITSHIASNVWTSVHLKTCFFLCRFLSVRLSFFWAL